MNKAPNPIPIRLNNEKTLSLSCDGRLRWTTIHSLELAHTWRYLISISFWFGAERGFSTEDKREIHQNSTGKDCFFPNRCGRSRKGLGGWGDGTGGHRPGLPPNPAKWHGNRVAQRAGKMCIAGNALFAIRHISWMRQVWSLTGLTAFFSPSIEPSRAESEGDQGGDGGADLNRKGCG